MKTINQNILKVKEGIICHQGNCQGVMGAGVALQIVRKYPIVLREYKEALKKGAKLGDIIITPVVDRYLSVATILGQDKYGKDRKVYTDYDALEGCLRELGSLNQQLYFPYKMSCGFAGGDWSKVLGLIEKYCPEGIICKL